MTNPIGISIAQPVLSWICDGGYEKTAYKLLLQNTSPSWLHSVEKGATTIWESWNGIDENGKPSESLNHYSKGAVAGWMIKDICGIHVDNSVEQFLSITPHPNKEIREASAWVDSAYGRIESSYSINGDDVNCRVSIPANSKIKMVLPSGEKKELTMGTYEFSESYKEV